MTMPTTLHMLEKARTGKRCTEKDWDYKILPKTIKEVLKKYDLNKTCNLDRPINEDKELADRFFQAGIETAARLGFLCTDTETIMTVTEEEITCRGFWDVPSELTLGEGKEQIVMKARKPSDPHPPIYAGAALDSDGRRSLHPTGSGHSQQPSGRHSGRAIAGHSLRLSATRQHALRNVCRNL